MFQSNWLVGAVVYDIAIGSGVFEFASPGGLIGLKVATGLMFLGTVPRGEVMEMVPASRHTSRRNIDSIMKI